MKIEFELKGTDEVHRALRLLGEKAPQSMGAALWKEGNDIMTKAKAITPFDTGVLAGSGLVTLPEHDDSQVVVTIGFGGAASDYAEVQHEELSYYHKPPTQAKYLEQPFTEAQDGMAQRIAESLQRDFK